MDPADRTQVTLIWAGIIGFGGAVCSIAYRVGTSFVHKVLTDNSASGLVESFTELPLWGRLVTPASGGLIAGAIIHFGSRRLVILSSGSRRFTASPSPIASDTPPLFSHGDETDAVGTLLGADGVKTQMFVRRNGIR